jgi:CYTH domain-containing protein
VTLRHGSEGEALFDMKDEEIERVFRVEQIPANTEKYPSEKVVQGYLVINEAGAEIRLRKKGDRYFQTFKGSGDLQRQELEIELTSDQFHRLWPATVGQRIEKIRYQIDDRGRKIELDLFKGDLEGLALAEVEFTSQVESEAFDPPDWFAEEVTYDVRYKNQNLARKGAPQQGS